MQTRMQLCCLHPRVTTLLSLCHTSQPTHRLARQLSRATMQPTQVHLSATPTSADDKEDAHEAFLFAYRESQPADLRIPGLQEFASAIWQRVRNIPSQSRDPLVRLFDEFDANSDGELSAAEVAIALQSHGVQITEAQAQKFIDGLIYHMAAADLHLNQPAEVDWCASGNEQAHFHLPYGLRLHPDGSYDFVDQFPASEDDE